MRVRSFWKTLWPFVAIFLLCITLFSPAVWFPFLSWDDTLLITSNRAVMSISPTTLGVIFGSFVRTELYMPLTFLTYQIEYFFVGLQPWLFHADNILLHALNACLVFALLMRWSRSRVIALVSALVFVVHPLNSEVAVWIGARNTLLSTFFALASLLLYERHLDIKKSGIAWLSAIMFALSLLAKATTIFLPIVLLLLDVLRSKRMNRETLREKLPFFLLSLTFGIIAFFGKASVDVPLSFFQTLLVMMKGAAFLLAKFFWPHPLAILYPSNAIPLLSVSLLVPVILFGVLAVWRWPNSKTSVLTRTGLLMALLFLLPSLFLPKHAGEVTLPFDRYAYMPMLGLLLALGTLLHVHIPKKNVRRRRTVIGVICLVLVSLALRTFLHLPVWNGSATLYTETLRHYPNLATLHFNIGADLLEASQFFEAESPLRRAISLRKNYAGANLNLGISLARQGRVLESMPYLQTAATLWPHFAFARYALGSAYLSLGEHALAIPELQAAIDTDPYLLSARYDIITAYTYLGMTEEARAETQRVLEMTNLSQ